MRQIIIGLLICCPALLSHAAQSPTGRWSGQVQIPGRAVQLVIDLDRDQSGTWVGSIIVPGYGVKGAPLLNVKVSGDEVAFDAGSALGGTAETPTAFKAHLGSAGGMMGEMQQGGNVAKFTLQNVGAAQVELPPKSTPVAQAIEGSWIGDYELGGYARHVTMEFKNTDAGGASVNFVIVGKATYNISVDLITENDGLLRVESRAYAMVYEGRVAADASEIKGALTLGPYDLPLVLRRSKGKTS